jgi:hypothetical protein
LINLSLLEKWRWKLLSNDRDVWKDVIFARYGFDYDNVGILGSLLASRVASSWWRDICDLDKNSNWFREAVENRIGSENYTSFWNGVWIGNQTLQTRFPSLFNISNQKVGSVSSMGTWIDNDWRWVLSWRRNFFQWEIPIYEEFLALIQQFVPSADDDMWVWCDSREEGFSVKSCYLLLYRKLGCIT